MNEMWMNEWNVNEWNVNEWMNEWSINQSYWSFDKLVIDYYWIIRGY